MSESDLTPYLVQFHHEFHDDVDDVVNYIKGQGRLATASKFADDAYTEALSIDLFADVHATVKFKTPRPAFFVPFKEHHLIFFDVHDVERVVRILYLWHARRSTRPDFSRQDDPLP